MKKRRKTEDRRQIRRSVRRVGVGRWMHELHMAGVAFVKNARSFLAGIGFALLVYLTMRWIGG